MRIDDKFKQLIKANDMLYLWGRLIKNHRDKDLRSLIKGYYESSDEVQSFLVKHNGVENPNDFVYYISVGVQDYCGAGMFGMLRGILDYLYVAERLNIIPVVHIGNKSIYYDSSINFSSNVFEYYFKQITQISVDEISSCKNVITARNSHLHLFIENDVVNGYFYNITNKDIERWADIFRKYIRLNDATSKYVSAGINTIIDNAKILGVHVRGTDFNIGFKNHPKIVSINDYIDSATALMQDERYKKIFLATDDITILMRFQKAFGEKLVFYDDVLRTSSNKGVHNIRNNRNHHNFLLGLEVIRDAFTLASCDGFISGPSYVAYAARFIKKSFDKEFEDEKLLSNGFYIKNSMKAIELEKEIKRDLHQNP